MANSKLATVAAVGLVLASGTVALADSSRSWNGWDNRSHNIDARQRNQAYNIQKGRWGGGLTQHEYLKLRAEQARIAEMERRAKADGHISRYERNRIDHAQDAARRHIVQERRDGQTAWWRRNWW